MKEILIYYMSLSRTKSIMALHTFLFNETTMNYQAFLGKIVEWFRVDNLRGFKNQMFLSIKMVVTESRELSLLCYLIYNWGKERDSS